MSAKDEVAIAYNEAITWKAAGLAVFASILWGGNSVSIKMGLAGMPPVALAAARFLLGGTVVLIWTRAMGVPLRLTPAERRPLAWLALIFVGQILTLNVGTYHTLASRSTVFISAHPFFTALFAHLFLRGDRLTGTKILGMTLSFAGVALIFSENLLTGANENIVGDALVLLSAVMLGARQVYVKHLTQGIHPGRVLLWQAGISLPFFVACSLILEDVAGVALSARVLGAVAYQGIVVAGFCFILWTLLLRRFRASHLSVFSFVTPLFGVLLSALLLGEPLTLSLLASMALVGAGIAVVNYES